MVQIGPIQGHGSIQPSPSQEPSPLTSDQKKFYAGWNKMADELDKLVHKHEEQGYDPDGQPRTDTIYEYLEIENAQKKLNDLILLEGTLVLSPEDAKHLSKAIARLTEAIRFEVDRKNGGPDHRREMGIDMRNVCEELRAIKGN